MEFMESVLRNTNELEESFIARGGERLLWIQGPLDLAREYIGRVAARGRPHFERCAHSCQTGPSSILLLQPFFPDNHERFHSAL